MRLENVARVPGLSHHLFSLRRVADAGNTYTGSAEGIWIHMKSEKIMFAPSHDQLNGLYASWVSPPKRDELAHAVITPGAPQSPQIVDISEINYAHAHMHSAAHDGEAGGCAALRRAAAMPRMFGGERTSETN